jgi:hypothetical protein
MSESERAEKAGELPIRKARTGDLLGYFGE